MLFLECVFICPSRVLTYYMTFACNTFREMLLFVNEYFPKLCTLSGAIDCLCDVLFIHPSVCPLRFALMGQNIVSVWQIYLKVVFGMRRPKQYFKQKSDLLFLGVQ